MVAGLKRLLNRGHLSGNKTAPSTKEYIIGFAGFWVMANEAHIISIAVREAYRRRGMGELLLASAVDMAPGLSAHRMTLEVRVSNTIAQNLYYKYGFTRIGLRGAYYTDDREDAVLMSTESLNSALFQRRLQRLKQAYRERWGVALDRITGPVRPDRR